MNKPRQYPRDYVTGTDIYEAEYRHLVYVLYCPVAKCIRYIGQTRGGLYYRLSLHRQDATAWGYSEKQKWFRALRALGTMPLIRRVGKFKTKAEAKAYETALIKRLWPRRPLLNIQDTPIDTRLAINREAKATARFMGNQI